MSLSPWPNVFVLVSTRVNTWLLVSTGLNFAKRVAAAIHTHCTYMDHSSGAPPLLWFGSDRTMYIQFDGW